MSKKEYHWVDGDVSTAWLVPSLVLISLGLGIYYYTIGGCLCTP